MKKEYQLIYTLDNLKKNISTITFTARNDKKGNLKSRETGKFL